MKAVVKQQRVEPLNYHLVHNETTGIICMSTITDGVWRNQYGRYKAIENKFLELDELENVFFSQNSFKRFKKSSEHLFELNALYLDIDYYKVGHSLESVLYAVDCKVADHLVPPPTQIIDSGHGVYLIWKIKRIPAMALRLWQAMQERFYEEFEIVGADRASLEPTRVLRFVGSVNPKRGEKKIVEVISHYPVEYDIHDLQYEYLKSPIKRSSKNRKTNNVIPFKKNIYTLYCNRRDDILSLCKMRDFNMTGMRENTLFLYRYYSCLSVFDEKTALEMMTALNAQFTEPCAESTIRRATKSAEKAAATLRYNYKSSTLVNLLHITQEEMQMKNAYGDYILKTIITKGEKYRRNNEKRRLKNRNVHGRTKRKQQVYDNVEMTRILKEKGFTQEQIAQQLGVSIRTVKRYYKQLKDSDQ